MIKKQLILIPLIILLSAVALIAVWFWPKIFTKNAHDNTVALTETSCDELSYNFIKLDIISKACGNTGACPLDRINLITKSWENNMNDLSECQTNPSKWSAWSYINDNEVYLKIRSDAYSLLKNSFGIEKKINDELSYNIFEVSQNTLSYLTDDKYCEKNEDCIIKEVSCVVGSYNHYSNHYFVNGCDVPLTPLRYPDSFSSEDIRVYEEKSNYFTTEQLDCTDNQCAEKYILNKTGEEF